MNAPYVSDRLNVFQTLHTYAEDGTVRVYCVRVNTEELARRGQLRPSSPKDPAVLAILSESKPLRKSNRSDSDIADAEIRAAILANDRNQDYYTVFPAEDTRDRRAWRTISGRSK